MTKDFAIAVGAYGRASANVPPRIAVVRLYDEAIKSIRLASNAAVERHFDKAHGNILRATAILLGLAGNLKSEEGPELATELKQTYLGNIMALHDGFGKPDMVERYDKLLEGLTALRNSWAQIAGVEETPASSE